jgi:hypothetical protein
VPSALPSLVFQAQLDDVRGGNLTPTDTGIGEYVCEPEVPRLTRIAAVMHHESGFKVSSLGKSSCRVNVSERLQLPDALLPSSFFMCAS